MALTHAFPTTIEVAELLTSLLGKDVAARKNDAVKHDLQSAWVYAVYEHEDGTIGAAIVCDVAAAAFGGAALSLIPAGMAQDSIKSGRVAQNLSENFHEVLNVCVSLFNGSGPRLKLGRFVAPPADAPADVLAFFGQAGQHLGLDLNVHGYGSGKAAIYVA